MVSVPIVSTQQPRNNPIVQNPAASAEKIPEDDRPNDHPSLAPSSLIKMSRVLLNNTDRFLRPSNSNGRRIDLTWTDLND